MSFIKQSDLQLALDEIAAKHGGEMNGDIVVRELISDPNNPNYGELRKQFDWNDISAAHAHRVAVANSLIREYFYIARDSTGRPIEIPFYIHTPGVRGSSYSQTQEIARDRQRSRELIMQELAACEGHVRRAQSIAAAVKLEAEMDHLLHACIDARKKVHQQPRTFAPSRGRRRALAGTAKSKPRSRGAGTAIAAE